MTNRHASSFPRRRESSQIEQQWLNLARQRLEEIQSKRVQTIPYEIVFARINNLLGAK